MRIWLIALLAACGGQTDETYELRGTAQKGPFALGSTVTIQELDDELRPTGKTYITETTDALGNFEAPSAITSQYVEVLVSGNFVAETMAAGAAGSTSSRVIADLSNRACNVNVNILTHLQGPRLVQLVRGGMSFSDAETQSSADVLAALHMPMPGTSFRCMDLTLGRDADAMLLATSAWLFQAAYGWRCCDTSTIITSMTDYVNELRLDLADGTLDPGPLLDAAAGNSRLYFCPGDSDYANRILADYYQQHGVTYSPLPWSEFLDADWDGVINKDDTTPDVPPCQ